LQSKTKEEIFGFIRQRLSFGEDIQKHLRYVNSFDFDYEQEVLDNHHRLITEGNLFEKEHKRFNMSGYDGYGERREGKIGSCTVSNMEVLNEFADLGIYDYTNYLFLDFYKGGAFLYFKYFYEDECHVIEFHGKGTTELIYEVFKVTIFSGKPTRRRR